MEYATDFIAPAMPARANFEVEAKAMSEAAAFLARKIVSRHSSVPIFAMVRIAADLAGHVTMTAAAGMGYGPFASITIAADVERPGEVLADAGALADLLAKARKNADARGQVRFIDDGNRVTIKAARGSWNLHRTPADDFPAPSGGIEPGAGAWCGDGAQFVGDLAALAPVMSSDDGRPWLQGVMLEARDMAGRERLVMVSTDGHGVAVASRAKPEGMAAMPQAILPADAVRAIIAAGKLAGPDAPLSWEYQAGARDGLGAFRFRLGAVAIMATALDATYPQWERAFASDLAPNGAQECLFPDLLPGAPVALMEKLAKPVKGALSWQPAARGLLASVAGDDGLVFGVCALTDADACGRKGFSYQAEEGQGEITGPDGVAYPVAFSASAIHMTRDQVRALIGESCFEVLAITIAGRVLHVLKWLYEQGDSRFLTVRPDGRCWSGKDAGRREYVTREQVERALSGEYEAAMPADYPPASDGAAPEYGDLCPGPMFPQEPWQDALRQCANMATTFFDNRGGKISMVADERGGNYRTRIPQRHQAQAMRLWQEQQAADVAPVYVRLTAMPEICPPEADQGESAPEPTKDEPEAVEAFSGPEIAPAAEPSSEAERLPAPEASPIEAPAAESAPEPSQADRLAALIAQAQAVAAELLAMTGAAAPLPVESEGQAINAVNSAPELIAPPAGATEPARAKRTAAHERAIRRAWAERKARREAVEARRFWHNKASTYRENAESFARDRDELVADYEKEMAAFEARAATLSEELAQAVASNAEWEALQHRTWTESMGHKAKRRCAVMLALAARKAAMIQRQRAHGWKTAHDRVKAAHDAAREAGAETAREMAARAGEERRLAHEAHERALRAETALAAVKARADGWPPAARPARVNVSFASAA